MKPEQKKVFDYSVKVQSAIAMLFDEDSDFDFHISQDELMEGDNLTHFIHALANVYPTRFFNKITGEENDILQFNHIANQLVFQYANLIENEETTP